MNSPSLLDDMSWLSCRWLDIAGINVLAMELSYVGELGFELHVRSSDLCELYDVLFRNGAGY